MKLLTNLALLGLGLAGSAFAKSVCCVPGCGTCLLEECHGGYCTNIFFNTCCADDKKAVFFENEEDYLETVAAGDFEG